LQGSTSDVRRSGLIAQTLGAVALGRLDDARDFGGKLGAIALEPKFGLFAAQLLATVALLDSGAGLTAAALEDLRPWVAPSEADTIRDRAVWMSELLGRHIASPRAAPAQLATLVLADSLAAAGHPREALARLNRVDVDATARQVDPFYRTIVHFRRAGWLAQLGDIDGARRELLWHEHTDLIGLPTGAPQAAEVDWAFGTLARWRRARLLDGAGGLERGAACAPYAAVLRHWAQAPAPYGARADTARMRVRALRCPGAV